MLGRLGLRSLRGHGGQRGSPGDCQNSYCVFVVWKRATQETETREKQFRVCSISRCYEPPFFLNVSEHRTISELVKQILFVRNRIRDTTD